MTRLHLTRASLRRDPSAAALAALFETPDRRPAVDAQRRAIWTLFADDPDRRRDFLWRDDGRSQFFILSARPPEDRHNLFVLETQPFEPALSSGDRLGFSLRANAVVDRARAARHRRVDVVMHALTAAGADGDGNTDRAALRMVLATREGSTWLARQGESRGFSVIQADATAYRVIDVPRSPARPARFGVLDLEGQITVTDPPAFVAAIAGGFGKARAFGCGLMLIRRA